VLQIHEERDVQIVSFRHVRSKVRLAGFNCHHLIPQQVIEAKEFGIFFGIMKSAGFSANDFCTNGMHLPCDEKTAYMIGRPIHRGGHPLYNKLVAEQIAQIERLPILEALAAISSLQQHLRSALSFSNLGGPKLMRNPMNSALERDLKSIDVLGSARLRMPRLS
jgi:hypothetical protein